MKTEIQTHIGGIPSIVRAYVYQGEGDNWNSPVIPAHIDGIEVLNMRRKPCEWRKSRMTEADFERIEQEFLNNEYA